MDFSELLSGGSANENYLIGDGIRKVVVRVVRNKSFNQTEAELKQIKLLAMYSFPTPIPMDDADGVSLFEIEGFPAWVMPHFPGNHAEPCREHAQKCGQVLAELHTFPALPILPSKHAYGFEALERYCGNHSDAFTAFITKALKRIRAAVTQDLPRAVIHGDLFPDNMLIDGVRLTAILDFEETCHYFRAYDVAMAILGFCTEDGRIDESLKTELLTGYQKLEKLQTQELTALPEFIALAALGTSLWRYEHKNRERSSRNYEEFIPLIENLLEF